VLQREGEKAAAGRVIDQAIAAKPTDPKTRRELAGVLTAMGRNEAGLALYQGLTLSLDDRFQVVVLHAAARQFAEARKQCEAILREKADDARARRWLADVTLWAAQYADALELEPTSRAIRRRLAEALTDAGQYAEAETNFRILLQNEPRGTRGKDKSRN
jgi:thioredoxin-like negative regulator of GroEL